MVVITIIFIIWEIILGSIFLIVAFTKLSTIYKYSMRRQNPENDFMKSTLIRFASMIQVMMPVLRKGRDEEEKKILQKIERQTKVLYWSLLFLFVSMILFFRFALT